MKNDKEWMELAVETSLNSDDPYKQVGVVIIDELHNEVIGSGANKLPNDDGKSEPQVVGKSGFVHAERNALDGCSPMNPSPRIMYTTLSPCLACAKLIEESNVDEVVYLKKHNDEGILYLVSKDIVIRKYIES